MAAHLTDAGKDLVDRCTRHKKGSVIEAFHAVNKRRLKQGAELVTRSLVYRYVSGRTHARNSEEKRDRPKAVTRAKLCKPQNARRRLCKKADSEGRITHQVGVHAPWLSASVRSCSQSVPPAGPCMP